MYQLNMKNAALGGFAVANNEAEHVALTNAGYEPKFVATEKEDEGRTVDSVRAELDIAGIEYKKTFGLAKLIALLPE